MLEKQIAIDKMEILENGIIQIREVTRILEDGKVISKQNTNRRIIEPDQDISKEEQEIKDIAAIVRTPERVQAWADKKAAIEAERQGASK